MITCHPGYAPDIVDRPLQKVKLILSLMNVCFLARASDLDERQTLHPYNVLVVDAKATKWSKAKIEHSLLLPFCLSS